MTDVYRIGVSMSLRNDVSAVLGVIARDLLGVRGEIGKTEAAMGRLKGALVGVGMVFAGGAILDGMGKLVKHGAELVHQQALMAEQGMTVREQADATAAAYKTASDVLGTSVTKNAQLVRELRGVLGNTTDSLTALPEFAKVSTLLGNLKGSQGDKDLAVLAKALELRGDLINPKTGKIDPAHLQEGLGQAWRTLIASGGLITPNDLMGVTKQAGPMARMMTAQQFYDTAFSAIMEMGGQRAGTALSAVGRAIYGGIMPKRNAMEFERLGLLNPNAVQHLGAGATQINPAGFKGIDTLSQQGLLAYVQDVIKPALDKAGIRSGSDQQKEMYRLFPTETARRMIGLFLQQAETVRRDIKLRSGAEGVDEAYKTSQTQDPIAKMRDLKEAWDSLLTALGAPLVAPATDALRYLAKEISSLTLFASQHQDGVRVIGELTAAFGGLLVVSGSLKLIGLAMGPVGTGIRALASGFMLFSAGAPASAGLAALPGGLSALAGAVTLTVGAIVGATVALTGAGIGAGRDPLGESPHARFRVSKPGQNMVPPPNANDKTPGWVSYIDKKLQDWGIEGKAAAPITLNSTHNIIVDGKKVQTTRTTSTYNVQSGTSQHDGSMSLLPAGLPSGGGN